MVISSHTFNCLVSVHHVLLVFGSSKERVTFTTGTLANILPLVHLKDQFLLSKLHNVNQPASSMDF